MGVFGWFIAIAIAVNIFKAIAKGVEEAKGSTPAPVPPPTPRRGRPGRESVEQQREAWQKVIAKARTEPSPTLPSRRPSMDSAASKTPAWQQVLADARAQARAPEEQGWEETESLEVAKQVRSLEGPVERKARVRVDYDEEAESVARQRVATAAARDGAISPADHKLFDEQIRAPATGATLKRGKEEIRRAMIWREILGPPVSMR